MPKPDHYKQTKTKAQAMLIDLKIPKKPTFHLFGRTDGQIDKQIDKQKSS